MNPFENTISDYVDAVITWVDGNDPVHKYKREKYKDDAIINGADRKGLLPTRFQSSFELWYCVQLIVKNAPWINKIYIVTDNQRPDWLDTYGDPLQKVEIIDHREVFKGYEYVLPTFSSRTIESVLHRIPNLNEKFIYFNDDFFLLRPTQSSDWFQDDKPKWRGLWIPNKGISNLSYRGWHRLKRTFDPIRHQNHLIGKRAEYRAFKNRAYYFRLAHSPFPVTKKIAMKYLEQSGNMKKNIRYRFRHPDQLNPLTWMANYSLHDNLAMIGPKDWGYANFELKYNLALKRINYIIKQYKLKSICIQSLDQAPSKFQNEVQKILENLL